MDTKKPIYKRKWFPYVAAVILLLAIIPSKDDKEKSAEVEQEQAQPKEKAQEVEAKSEESSEEVVEEVSKIVPLTKDEVLAKFELMSEEYGKNNYIDGKFLLKDGTWAQADFYFLEDTDHYRNASVLFKFGEIVKVKFIAESGINPKDIFTEFGLDDVEFRESPGMVKSYEIALDDDFWTDNIESYPFEID